MKRILITGANSYIGTSVEKYLSQWPEEYQVDTIDMKDGSWREKSFSGYDSVFHVAGIAHINTKKLDKSAQEKYWSVNAELPIAVAKKAKNEKVGCFVFLSSMSVYGEIGNMCRPVVITQETPANPKDIYGRSKLMAENKLRELQTDTFNVCILRPPMVYGSGCKGNYQIMQKAARRMPIFPDIRNERSMLFIDNLCMFVKLVMDKQIAGIHFPQDPDYICTSTMVKAIAKEHGRNIRTTRIFNPFIMIFSIIFPIFSKVFGGLIYLTDDAHLLEGVLSQISFPESVRLTEMKVS